MSFLGATTEFHQKYLVIAPSRYIIGQKNMLLNPLHITLMRQKNVINNID